MEQRIINFSKLSFYQDYLIFKNFIKIFLHNIKNPLKKFKNKHLKKTIFIIAAGPSLNEENLELLNDKIIITVNGSYEIVKSLKPKKFYWLIGSELRLKENNLKDKKFCDGFFYVPQALWTNDTFFNYIFSGDHVFYPPLRINKFLRPEILSGGSNVSISIEKEFRRIGGSSLFSAIQLGIFMGASRIILLGADFGFKNQTKTHFDSKITLPEEISSKEHFERLYINKYEPTLLNIMEVCKKKDINILNASKFTFEKVLNKTRLEDEVN